MDTNALNIKIKKTLGNNAKKIISKIIFPLRNKFLLYNLTNKAKQNQVNLNYWLESENLGDTLSPLIVNHMLGLKNISPDIKINKTKHLYAVGSVLTAGIQDCTVWGSGVLNASLTYRLENRKFDVRAVRGPLTRAVLIDYGYNVPEVYGDPAIILPEIYTPLNPKKRAKYGIILHKDHKVNFNLNDTLVIDICTSDYKEFINQLNSVEIVISSSLHGIILAEAYGIQAVMLKPKVDILKYYDWYYSTSRLSFPIAENIDNAKKITPAELPNLEILRREIKEAFPYDLYQ